ncbi:hypothetical protein EV586_102225 [Tumebacillus sp. BK434]|uniref:hypothetical protein n=1 Tax=Tumebacillus sp. BK434 TaxID=2512169 RepID=UPI00104DE52D|nr:hypothetical protein [Tumebacillus sp. BK434]TCP57781.1 hypothetical protein EV586_102225 [Tumebacillus sp. BK434]
MEKKLIYVQAETNIVTAWIPVAADAKLEDYQIEGTAQKVYIVDDVPVPSMELAELETPVIYFDGTTFTHGKTVREKTMHEKLQDFTTSLDEHLTNAKKSKSLVELQAQQSADFQALMDYLAEKGVL